MRLEEPGRLPLWQLVPGVLYQAARQHHQPLAMKRATVQAYGITEIVSLAPRLGDMDLGALGVRWQHLPISDGQGIPTELLVLAAELAQADGAVLTMCRGGRNRSGLLSALILREKYGLPGHAALALVQRERPNAMVNEHFNAWLEDLP